MLSEREQSYYAELFQTCDVDGSGKFQGLQVSELFRSSGLSQEVLVQITELCGAKRLGHFGRSQFYIALKLIAAAQCGLPVSHDSISAGMDIPLPKFHKATNEVSGTQFQGQVNVTDNVAGGERQQQGQLPPPPTSSKKSHGRNLSGQFRSLQNDTNPLQIHLPQTPGKDIILQPDTISPPIQSQMSGPPIISNPQSPPISPQTAPIGPKFTSPTSPTTSVTNSYQSQQMATSVTTATKKVTQSATAEHTDIPQKRTDEWARFESDDEKHGLLGSGKKEGWDKLTLPDYSSSYSSDTESVEDVWSINDEQREYYVKQFQNIEPDVNGHIIGNVAKEFFEKSKLTNHELSKIWNLSDLNKDGALSLEEFCIAMHLVVLRRNEVEIPDKLPFSLMPYNAFTNEEPFASDLPDGSTLKRLTPTSLPETQIESMIQIQESPQISSSEVSSPSITPANFDFQKPEPTDTNEAHIIHPKARRLSPETISEISECRPERGRAFSEPVSPSSGDGNLHDSEQSHQALTKQRSNTTASHHLTDHNHLDAATASLQSRPRPSVKKNTVPGVLPGHILPPVPPSSQPSMESSVSVDGTHEPPVPPPRPGQHIRSMSVDYSKAPPAVPPRISPKDTPSMKKLAQFKHFEPIQSQEVLNIIPGSSATTTNHLVRGVQIERHRRSQSLDFRHTGGQDTGDSVTDSKTTAVAWNLLGEDFVDGSAEREAEFALAAQRQASRDKKELQMAIRTHKERNSTLKRLNSELNQELQEVMEQRIALEIQLEHLRPFFS